MSLPIPIALIKGRLNRSQLAGILEDIRLVARLSPDAMFYLIIDSEGGDIIPTLNFIKEAKATRLKFAIKIYKAMSAAAFLTFSLADPKNVEIATTAQIGFHMGHINVEASDITLDGKIPAESQLRLLEYNRELHSLMIELKLSNNLNLMAQLAGSGYINLSSDDCYHLGLAYRLFSPHLV